MKHNIYLDHNATTPVLPEVVAAMQPYGSDLYGNPSSIHESGTKVARAIREARREATALLGAQEESEIVFTSGGTESNNAALRSAIWTQKGKHRIVTTVVEHSSIIKLAKALEEENREVIYCPVTKEGHLDREKFREALTENTAVVSVMMANNETGVIFPIEEIAREVKSKGILFHVDGVQAAGKMLLALKDWPIDFFSLSGHKLGGPKGIGVLYLRKGVAFRPLIFGGSQERGRRAGTENVPGIIGLGAACKRRLRTLAEDGVKVRGLRDYFEEAVLNRISGVEINGDRESRIPNTSNLAFEGADSEALLILLDQEGICASSGSACLSGSFEPSRVLKAMGWSAQRAKSSIRFSFGTSNTRVEIDRVVGLLERFVRHLRQTDFQEQHPHSVV